MQDVVHLDVQQNRDEQNLVVIRPFLDEVHQFLVDVVVDAEPPRLLKMDCFLDEVGVEPRHLQRKDCFLDEVQQELVRQVQLRPLL